MEFVNFRKFRERNAGRSRTHHVDDLRARVSVLLHGLAIAVVLSFTHQQHLLWVIHRQAHLRMFNTALISAEG